MQNCLGERILAEALSTGCYSSLVTAGARIWGSHTSCRSWVPVKAPVLQKPAKQEERDQEGKSLSAVFL